MKSPTALCPAAIPLAGPPIGGPAVVCGVLRLQNVDDVITVGRVSPLITSLHDPSMYFGLCCGQQDGSIMGTARGDGSWPQHYTSCTIWQENKEAIWAARDRAWTPMDRYVQPVDEEDWLERTRG